MMMQPAKLVSCQQANAPKQAGARGATLLQQLLQTSGKSLRLVVLHKEAGQGLLKGAGAYAD